VRRRFLKGAAMGGAGGAALAMGLYSYSPLRKRHFSTVERKMTDIGVCRSIKVTKSSAGFTVSSPFISMSRTRGW